MEKLILSASLNNVSTNNNPGKIEISSGDWIYNDTTRIKTAAVIFSASRKSKIPAGSGMSINPRMRISPIAKKISLFFPKFFTLYYCLFPIVLKLEDIRQYLCHSFK